MRRQRIIEILEAYRPGEGLESDPEVREALELAARDPELSELRHNIQEFDEVFSKKLAEIEVPHGLQASILEASKNRPSPSEGAVQGPARIIQWFYPASFAAAAAIIILLALSFTFWNRPEMPGGLLVNADATLDETAHSLYDSLSPRYYPKKGNDVLDYLQSKGGAIPVSLPGNIAFDESFACDVVEVNGNKVSIICFKAPDNSKSMHLFTFKRGAFPEVRPAASPEIRQDGDSCCATWVDEKEDQIHVLYSDKGENNLRRVLDI
jgi:hypothetical protein